MEYTYKMTKTVQEMIRIARIILINKSIVSKYIVEFQLMKEQLKEKSDEKIQEGSMKLRAFEMDHKGKVNLNYFLHISILMYFRALKF